MCVDVCAYVCMSVPEYMHTCVSVCACECVHCTCGVWWGRGALGSAQPGLIYVFSTSTCFHQSRDTCFWTKEAFLGLQRCRPTHTSVTHSQGSRLPGGNPRGCPRRERPPRRAGPRSAASKAGCDSRASAGGRPLFPGLTRV